MSRKNLERFDRIKDTIKMEDFVVHYLNDDVLIRCRKLTHKDLKKFNNPYVVTVSYEFASANMELIFSNKIILVVDILGHMAPYINPNELKKIQSLNTIDEQIAGWEEYKEQWSSVVDNYQEEQDRLLAEQVLGIELEGENWRTRLDNLAQYVAEYKALMAEVKAAQNGDLSVTSSSSSLGSIIGGTGGGGRDPDSAGGIRDPWRDKESFDKYVSEGGDIGEWIAGNAGYTSSEMLDYANQIRNDKIESSGSGYQQYEDVNDFLEDYVPAHDRYADGTLSASGGLSLVGENGPELRVLGSGDGIIPSDITRNLLDIGKLGLNNLGNHLSISIGNVSLPNVTDTKSFIQEIKNLAYQQAYKRA